MNTATNDDEELYQSLRANVKTQAFTETQKGIDANIESAKEEVRNGTGFMGTIKALLFKLLEWIDKTFNTHITEWVANLTGNPIPKSEDVQSLSGVIAESTSKAMIPENAEERQKIADMQSPDEFATYVTGKVQADLDVYKKAHPEAPFKEEDLQKAATQTGVAAKSHFTEIKQLLNFDTELAKQLQESVKPEMRKELGQLAGKADGITDTDLKVMSTIVGPALKKFVVPGALKETGSEAYNTVAKELEAALKSNPALLKSTGMNFSDAGISILAGKLAIGATPKILEQQKVDGAKNIKVPQELLVKLDDKTKQAVYDVVERQTNEMTQQTVVTTTAKVVYETYGKWGKVMNLPGDDAQVIKAYEDHNKDSAIPLYQYAVEKNKTFDDEQRKIIGRISAQSMTQTLKQFEGQEFNREQFAQALTTNTETNLKKAEKEISNASVEKSFWSKTPVNTVEVINKSLDKDILKETAAGLGDAIRSSADGDQIFGQLKIAHSKIKELNTSIATAKTNNPSYKPATPANYQAPATNGNVLPPVEIAANR